MVGFKVALLFVFALTPALANPNLLLVRQVPSLPGTTCTACNNLDNDITTCTAQTSPELELSCLCGSSTVSDFNGCVSCAISSNPGAAVVSEVQSAQSEFYSACAQGGDPIGSPPALGPATTTAQTTAGFASPTATFGNTPTSSPQSIPGTSSKNGTPGMAVGWSMIGSMMGVVMGGAAVFL